MHQATMQHTSMLHRYIALFQRSGDQPLAGLAPALYFEFPVPSNETDTGLKIGPASLTRG